MARLTLTQIKCVEETSGWGCDDVYIEVNGTSFWGPVEMCDDNTLPIDQGFDFQDSATVVVWEYDTGSDHDLIGIARFNTGHVGSAERRIHMHGDGSHYELWARVD